MYINQKLGYDVSDIIDTGASAISQIISAFNPQKVTVYQTPTQPTIDYGKIAMIGIPVVIVAYMLLKKKGR